MAVYALDGRVPVLDPSSFLHPQAVLIGDVIIGPRCYIGPGASLRGDFGRIEVGAGCNVQDGCVLHTFPGQQTLLEEDAHIGHRAVLHGCTVRRGALVGIGAIVMDAALLEAESFVGAACFVPARFTVPARTLVLGVPARIVRTLTPEELGWKARGTREYQDLTLRCLHALEACAPLPAVEPGRSTFSASDLAPLYTLGREQG